MGCAVDLLGIGVFAAKERKERKEGVLEKLVFLGLFCGPSRLRLGASRLCALA